MLITRDSKAVGGKSSPLFLWKTDGSLSHGTGNLTTKSLQACHKLQGPAVITCHRYFLIPCAAHGPFASTCSWHCLPSFLAHPCWQVQGKNEVSQACKLTQHSSWTATVVFGMHVICQNNSVPFHQHCPFQGCSVCSGHLYSQGSVSTSPTKIDQWEE